MGKRYANGNAVFPWDATRYEGWIQRVSELEFQEDEDYVLWEMCKFLEDHGYINTEKDQLAACLTHMLMKSWYKNVTGNVRDEIRRYLASREGENFNFEDTLENSGSYGTNTSSTTRRTIPSSSHIMSASHPGPASQDRRFPPPRRHTEEFSSSLEEPSGDQRAASSKRQTSFPTKLTGKNVHYDDNEDEELYSVDDHKLQSAPPQSSHSQYRDPRINPNFRGPEAISSPSHGPPGHSSHGQVSPSPSSQNRRSSFRLPQSQPIYSPQTDNHDENTYPSYSAQTHAPNTYFPDRGSYQYVTPLVGMGRAQTFDHDGNWQPGQAQPSVTHPSPRNPEERAQSQIPPARAQPRHGGGASQVYQNQSQGHRGSARNRFVLVPMPEEVELSSVGQHEQDQIILEHHVDPRTRMSFMTLSGALTEFMQSQGSVNQLAAARESALTAPSVNDRTYHGPNPVRQHNSGQRNTYQDGTVMPSDYSPAELAIHPAAHSPPAETVAFGSTAPLINTAPPSHPVDSNPNGDSLRRSRGPRRKWFWCI